MPPHLSASTVGSILAFDPEAFLSSWSTEKLPKNNDLRAAIVRAFHLKQTDDYVYHAIASVTLAQTQVAIDHGNSNGLHAWYHNGEDAQVAPASTADIDAYTQIFSSATVTTKALAAFVSNAKKGSLRALIGQNLQQKFFPPMADSGLQLPGKQKNPAQNPYLDFWAWSCQCLEWSGPNEETANTKISHAILPVFYHHFGCICPTYDALSLIQLLAKSPKKTKGLLPNGRAVIDIGSGNGYWTLLLRRQGLTVHAVDNALSRWRTMWISDTFICDGVDFITEKHVSILGSQTKSLGDGCKDAILLLVYPQVSGDFTRKVVDAYMGDYIVVAGTQNNNGFTGFQGETMASWMAREKPEFEPITQIPLPSFAGKDEALFVFRRQGSYLS